MHVYKYVIHINDVFVYVYLYMNANKINLCIPDPCMGTFSAMYAKISRRYNVRFRQAYLQRTHFIR